MLCASCSAARGRSVVAQMLIPERGVWEVPSSNHLRQECGTRLCLLSRIPTDPFGKLLILPPPTP